MMRHLMTYQTRGWPSAPGFENNPTLGRKHDNKSGCLSLLKHTQTWIKRDSTPRLICHKECSLIKIQRGGGEGGWSRRLLDFLPSIGRGSVKWRDTRTKPGDCVATRLQNAIHLLLQPLINCKCPRRRKISQKVSSIVDSHSKVDFWEICTRQQASRLCGHVSAEYHWSSSAAALKWACRWAAAIHAHTHTHTHTHTWTQRQDVGETLMCGCVCVNGVCVGWCVVVRGE